MATRRTGTYRQAMLDRQPDPARPVCERCGRAFPADQIEADHVQELTDNGFDDWTVPLCRPCHRAKTRDARLRRRRGRTYRQRRVPGRVVVGFVGWSMVAGSVGWLAGFREEVTTAAAVAALVVALLMVVWPVRRRGRRRAERVAGLVDPLARAMGTMPDLLRLRVRRWDGRDPVAGQVVYGRAFRDDAGSKERAEVEALLTRKVGRRLRFGWYPTENVVTWEPGPPDRKVAQAAARAAATARVRAGIEAEIGPLDDFTVTGWDGATMLSFTARYPSRARGHSDRMQDAVEDKVAAMMPDALWRAVWDTGQDVVTFTDTPDPLADVVHIGPVGDVCDLSALPMGVRDDGKPWTLRLAGSAGALSVLVGGAPGSGKGSIIWGLVHALTPALRTGHVQLWGADPKGGMELGKGRQVWSEFAVTSTADINRLLERAVETMHRRAEANAAAGIRRHTPTPDEPLIVVVVDEIGALTKYSTGDRKDKDRAAALLGLLLTQGRAAGMCVVAALQDPRKAVLDERDLFTTRICLRCTEPIHPDLLLGKGARAAGARADRISTETPGVGYVMVDNDPPVRVRTAWVPDARIEEINTAAAALRGGGAAPEVWEDVYARDLAEHDRVRLDVDGAVVEATVEGLCGEDRVEVDWRAGDGRVGCADLADDDVVSRRS